MKNTIEKMFKNTKNIEINDLINLRNNLEFILLIAFDLKEIEDLEVFYIVNCNEIKFSFEFSNKIPIIVSNFIKNLFKGFVIDINNDLNVIQVFISY